LLVLGGCARMPNIGITALKPKTQVELETYLLAQQADLDQFRLRGPFEVTTREDIAIPLSPRDSVSADLYLSASTGKAPLVILMHGHDNSKDDHAYQALHLASWGMHSLTVQLPNHGPWITNGKTLARIVALVRSRPEILDSRIDIDEVILAGHSFGAASVAVALAEGSGAAGGILLDPAFVGRGLPSYLVKIAKPVMVLGADETVTVARNRSIFYRNIRSRVAEISIRHATHEDGQFPIEGLAIGSDATEEHQLTFVSALTAAALSLAATGGIDYAWSSFSDAVKTGKFVNAKKK
jgi:pimeloyl-ACP methyl ester carboxylesterase